MVTAALVWSLYNDSFVVPFCASRSVLVTFLSRSMILCATAVSTLLVRAVVDRVVYVFVCAICPYNWRIPLQPGGHRGPRSLSSERAYLCFTFVIFIFM